MAVVYLTIVIGQDGRIYNLANREHPSCHGLLPKNAFCCTEEEYVKLMKERGQEIKLFKKDDTIYD